jgi:hypothetical protein
VDPDCPTVRAVTGLGPCVGLSSGHARKPLVVLRVLAVAIIGYDQRVDRALLIIGVIAELASVGAIVHAWRHPGRFPVKLFWTMIVLIPFLGILAFAVWRDPPPPSDPTDRPPARDWDMPPHD